MYLCCFTQFSKTNNAGLQHRSGRKENGGGAGAEIRMDKHGSTEQPTNSILFDNEMKQL